MGFWLNAWAGDHAGSVVGRQPYRALVALTHTDADFPAALFQIGDLDGIPWYFNISATCLTPNTMSAIVTKADDVGDYVWSLEVTPWKWSGESTKESWKPGVHLFSVMMFRGGSQSGTIATVIVPPKIKKVINLSAVAVQTMLTVSRRARVGFHDPH